MTATLKKSILSIRSRPGLRTALQVLVSVILIGVLIAVAHQSDLGANLAAISPGLFVLALVAQGFGFVLSTYRWQLLLRSVGVNERFWVLLQFYLIGLFFSLFLPTGAGGDAVRMYQVSRRSGRIAETVIGTLQERLLGLGTSLLIGLAAMFYYLPLVPAGLQVWILVIALLGAVGIAFVLYPQLLFTVTRRIWRVHGERSAPSCIGNHLIVRITASLQPITTLPPLPLLRLLIVLAISLGAGLLGISTYYLIGRSLDLGIGLIAFCLVVPLVWIVRMAPVSLGGIGVGEGSFVFLMGMFSIASGPSLALALAVLAVQTSFALAGGALLALRIARGSWRSAASSEERGTLSML